MSPETLLEGLGRALPVAVFLLAITVVADLSDRAGVFDVAGRWVAHRGRGRTWLLWLVFAALSLACTIALSLDTTAVLLTPVAIAVARGTGVSPVPFALTTLWIANTGSLLLPVSNLTNLLAVDRFDALGVDHGGYLRLMLAPALASAAATLLVIAVLHRRDLATSYAVERPERRHDRTLLAIAGAVCLLIGPAFALGLEPWLVAIIAAAVLAGATAWRSPAALRGLPVPWVMAGAFTVLTVAVGAAHDAGLLDPLVSAVGRGVGLGDLAAVAAGGALVSNAINNLPAYLALEPVALGEPVRLAALLIGTNAGPLVTPWASLATLLWLQRCRTGGLRIPLPRLAALGLVCAVASVLAGVLALALVR
ncbi:arsenic transport integral membrane protein ArsB [Alteromonas gracilis]